jgi:hypothetical protein
MTWEVLPFTSRRASPWWPTPCVQHRAGSGTRRIVLITDDEETAGKAPLEAKPELTGGCARDQRRGELIDDVGRVAFLTSLHRPALLGAAQIRTAVQVGGRRVHVEDISSVLTHSEQNSS